MKNIKKRYNLRICYDLNNKITMKYADTLRIKSFYSSQIISGADLFFTIFIYRKKRS